MIASYSISHKIPIKNRTGFGSQFVCLSISCAWIHLGESLYYQRSSSLAIRTMFMLLQSQALSAMRCEVYFIDQSTLCLSIHVVLQICSQLPYWPKGLRNFFITLNVAWQNNICADQIAFAISQMRCPLYPITRYLFWSQFTNDADFIIIANMKQCRCRHICASLQLE